MINGGAAYFMGESIPVFNTVCQKGFMESCEIEISPDGRWAGVVTSDDKLWLLDGQDKTKIQVLEKWCYSLAWQPQVK
jgi:hypothetical protein